jgi:hypothetical protein
MARIRMLMMAVMRIPMEKLRNMSKVLFFLQNSLSGVRYGAQG